MLTDEKISKIKREYFPEDLDIENWDVVSGVFEELLKAEFSKPEDLIAYLEKASEFGRILGEEHAWRYINMSRYADKSEFRDAFNSFYQNIISKSSKYDFELKKKFYNSPLREKLDENKYAHLNRIIANGIELFREENIPLQVEEQKLSNQYGEIIAGMTVNYKGEEKTLQQLGIYLKDKDRSVREEVYHLSSRRVMEDEEKLNKLFDDLKELRIKQAKNAGFDNYRDYMHQAKGRFAYTPDDIYKFHNAVEKVVIPYLKELSKERKDILKIDTLRPWDTSVELDGSTLKPFEKIEEFVSKGVQVLDNVDHQFALELNKMDNSGFLDLDNRKGKAPGGYCAPLSEHASSFIFMNAVGLHRDLVTLVHESGHTMHNLLSKDIKIETYSNVPSEIAELASMSMEFLTMDYWDIYYNDEASLKKAKREQLEGTLKFLPWCMIVDALQQWIYTNPEHTAEERTKFFMELTDRFNLGVEYSGLEKENSVRWMRQLHIFEVPFYYIEYGIAQLGALAVYRNYRNDPKKAVEEYKKFLSLAYSKPMNEIYESAGIKFDFSEEYISELVEFVKDETAKLK